MKAYLITMFVLFIISAISGLIDTEPPGALLKLVCFILNVAFAVWTGFLLF